MNEKYRITFELSLDAEGAAQPGWTVNAAMQHASGEDEELMRRQHVTPEWVLGVVENFSPLRKIVVQGNSRAREVLADHRDRLRRSIAQLEAAESALADWDRVADTNYPGASDQGTGDDSPTVACERCGVRDPDYPGQPGCSLPRGHDRVDINDFEQLTAVVEVPELYDHARPEGGAFWNMPEDWSVRDSLHAGRLIGLSIPECDLNMVHCMASERGCEARGFDQWGCPPNCPRRKFREAHKTVNVGEQAVSDVEGPEDLKDVAAHLRGGWLGENATPERVEDALREHVKQKIWRDKDLGEHLLEEHGFDEDAIPGGDRQRTFEHARDHRPMIEQLAREREARGKTEEGKQRDGIDW